MTQVEVEHAGVALAQGCGRGPRELVLFALPQRRSHVHVGGGPVERLGRRLAVGAGPALTVEPVERPVAGDPSHPAPERAGLLEVAEALPGDEEHVLGHLGRGVLVAHDPPGDVVDGVEPLVEQPAERPLVPVRAAWTRAASAARARRTPPSGGVVLSSPWRSTAPHLQHVPPVSSRDDDRRPQVDGVGEALGDVGGTRTQPCDAAWPMLAGSSVPWMPTCPSPPANSVNVSEWADTPMANRP